MHHAAFFDALELISISSEICTIIQTEWLESFTYVIYWSILNRIDIKNAFICIRSSIRSRYIWRHHNDLFWLSYAPFSRQWTISLYYYLCVTHQSEIFFEISLFSSLSFFVFINRSVLSINGYVPLWFYFTEQSSKEEAHRRRILNDALKLRKTAEKYAIQIQRWIVVENV